MTKTTKTVVIDGQILQTAAWHRGMGKYTLQLLREMSLHATANQQTVFFLLLNDNLQTDQDRLATIKQLCPEIRLLRLSLPLPDTSGEPDHGREHYVEVLDAQLHAALPTAEFEFFMTSLFFFDFYAEFPTKAYRSMLFYDLTPLLFWQDLGGYFPPDLYMGRFRQVLEAQTIYSISDTTRHDLVQTFGVDSKLVVNINGGFSKIAERSQKPLQLAVPERFVLMPTGDLPHKNNDVAVAGFEKYVSETGDVVRLLITSRFSDASKRRLTALSPNVMFTNNISDEELEWLYEHAEAVMFASKYEGLGIPILDAVANDKPVIASRIPVFEEMSKAAFYYFDPESPLDLSKQLASALRSDDYAERRLEYADIMERYSWRQTFADLWRRMRVDQSALLTVAARARTPRIAVACVHPGIANQIGRKVEALHGQLSAQYEVDYFFDANGQHYREMERPTFLDQIAHATYDISALQTTRYQDYDMVVYVVDESAVPSRLMQRAILLPGVLVCPAVFADSQDVAWQLMRRQYQVVYDRMTNMARLTQKVTSAIESVRSRQVRKLQSVKRFDSIGTILRKIRIRS